MDRIKTTTKYIFFLSIFALFYIYMKDLFLQFVKGTYASDFPQHIETATNGNAGYSLMHRLIKLCYMFDNPIVVLSNLMSILVIITGIGIFIYIKSIHIQDLGIEVIIIISVSLIFTSNIFIPGVFPHLYDHYTIVSQPWHNSTYILMRMCGVFVILLYFKISEYIKNGNPIPNGLNFCFLILLTLCNYSKPNFFLAFAPLAFFSVLYYFIKEKGKNIRPVLQFGLAVICSMPILIYQVNIVYDESEQSKIDISGENFFDYFIGNQEGNIFIYEFVNLFFPLFMLGIMVFLKYVKKQNDIDFFRIIQAFILFVISHMQQLLMIDDGPRRDAGNYAWGIYCFGLILFMVCITEWIKIYKNGVQKSKLIYMIGNIIYMIHIVCGIAYFVILHNETFYGV